MGCTHYMPITRGGSRTAATSKMECFVIIVNGFQPLTIITKHSILDVAAVLDPPLYNCPKPIEISIKINIQNSKCNNNGSSSAKKSLGVTVGDE